ncbi:DUF488 domain-containing protein [Aequorivita sp. H23M31]|uniref:DUF488 domain-containing protein n=1 Tax=Aequorivita ciconiae TaxID=2494375 RepID=A0A410G2P5_9FLAO|nr:DUF488 domain-containing protein [Aequorivita sp. H23M31]QAA81526.1 DUF488 domain-containing protein [Aequorivita sp. H23M31]
MKTIWTIGHSTHPLKEFLHMLKSFDIELLMDVRSYPGSRKFPQFNKENMEISLPENGFEYDHMRDLGGRRKVDPNSKNDAWRLASFRGYADYMDTEEFSAALKRLEKIAAKKRTAIMCAEAVWWSCHRSMISDALKVRGWKVLHIMNDKTATEHPYTAPAKIVDGKLDYSKPKED